MRDISTLTRAELENALLSIQSALYAVYIQPSVSYRWDPDKVRCDADVVGYAIEALDLIGLTPEEEDSVEVRKIRDPVEMSSPKAHSTPASEVQMYEYESTMLEWVNRMPRPTPPEGPAWELVSCLSLSGPNFHYCIWKRPAHFGVEAQLRRAEEKLRDLAPVRELLDAYQANPVSVGMGKLVRACQCLGWDSIDVWKHLKEGDFQTVLDDATKERDALKRKLRELTGTNAESGHPYR